MAHNFFDLTGRIAIVTGSSRGLGQYMAIALAKAGAHLILTARKKDNCNETIKRINNIGSTAEAFSLEVREEESIGKFAATISNLYDSIDILVNNAGCNIRKPVTQITWDDWSKVIDTNLRGTFFVTKAILPMMFKRNYGRIINIGSVTSVFGYAGVVPYCASRGGVLQMTKAMADEFGKKNITVNCLAPGWFKTEQTKNLYENTEWVEYLVDRIPLCRPGKPSDLDGAVVFLASETSEYITGQILLVDGGISTGATRATVK
jgi:NAD(P)-dependent dehydrogenase (short-subunit alcohol dehydrogenase family)